MGLHTFKIINIWGVNQIMEAITAAYKIWTVGIKAYESAGI